MIKEYNLIAYIGKSLPISMVASGKVLPVFATEGERIEITHKSASRSTYAQGSLRAVRFLAQQRSGLFDMFDVLGLKQVGQQP